MIKKNIIDKIWVRKVKKSQKYCFFLEKKISGEDTLSKKERIFNRINHDYLIFNFIRINLLASEFKGF